MRRPAEGSCCGSTFRAAAALERVPVTSEGDVPESAVWFDLVTPTLQEDKIVERRVGIAVPTREEMQEIEVTSRLYVENGARYMTATLMCQSDTDTPEDHAGHLHPVRAIGSSRCATTSRGRS